MDRDDEPRHCQSMSKISGSARRRATRSVPAVQVTLKGAELAVATAQVVAARTAMGFSGACDTRTVAEFQRMVLEKPPAFFKSALAMGPGLSTLTATAHAYVAKEAEHVAAQVGALARSRSPLEAVVLQTGFAVAWFTRAARFTQLATGSLLTMQDRATAPLHQVARANARRLKGG